MRYFFVALFGLAQLAACSQHRHFFTQFTTREGLSNNSVNAIIQDSTGFIWIGTDDGLNRFDGHRFKIFRNKAGDETSIISNTINALEIDQSGNVWCGGKDWAGVSVFNSKTNSFQRIPFPGEIIQRNVLSIFCDDEGSIWVGTDNGIFKFGEEDALVSVCVGENSSQRVFGNAVSAGHSFSSDNGGRGFWIATNSGVNYYEYESGKFYHQEHNPESKFIFSADINKPLIADRNGILWTCVHVDNVFWKWLGYDYLHDEIVFETTDIRVDDDGLKNNFRSYACSSDNKIWLGNNARTPLIFDVITREFDYSLVQLYPGSLTNHTMLATYFDNNGNTWVGMEEGLFVEFDIFKNVEVNWLGEWDEFQTPRIKSVYQPDSSSLIFAANQELHWWHRERDTIVSYPILINGKRIEEDTRYVGRKSDDEIWLATFFGLYSFNLRTKTFANELPKFPIDWRKYLVQNSHIKFVFSTEDGSVFIGCAGSLFVANPSLNYYKRFRTSDGGKTKLFVREFAERNAGGWWFTNVNTGQVLFMNHASDTLHNHKLPENFPIQPITICEDRDEHLWLGSWSQGLVKLNIKNNDYKAYSIEDGLHSNCVYKVLADETGTIWAITSNGVARYNELLDRFEKIFSEYSLPYYDHRDVGHFGMDARLYLFSQNIFYSIDTKTTNSLHHSRPVLFTNIRVMDEDIPTESNAILSTLKHKQNNITFEFSVLNFNPNNAVRYEFMLEGLNDMWSGTEGESHVSFNGLAPGDYIFKVRSDNGTGIFSEGFSSLAFTILPPWYATWWFHGLVIFALVALCVFISRKYAKSKLKKREAEFEKIRLVEEERLRIARDMHDDLGGGLSSIRMMSESAQKRPAENKLKEISTSATELVERMRQIVWALNQEQNTVEDLCYYIIAYSRDFLRRSEMEVSFSEVIHSDFKLSSKQRRNIFLTVKEALHNVVKHSGATKVEIQFEMNEGVLKISVADNGKGLPRVSENRFGNGLRNMKQRVEELGGMLEFISDSGLRIELLIRL
ncbi:MAG: two-component regulator propeller domain-containing protein [Flavobacteriales bacterium]